MGRFLGRIARCWWQTPQGSVKRKAIARIGARRHGRAPTMTAATKETAANVKKVGERASVAVPPPSLRNGTGDDEHGYR